jgi:hypothetical protein
VFPDISPKLEIFYFTQRHDAITRLSFQKTTNIPKTSNICA